MVGGENRSGGRVPQNPSNTLASMVRPDSEVDLPEADLLDADLLVIGAGPAGCAAAITAAAAGRDVVVVDRASFPRDKTCGDGLTTEALRTLEALGLPLRALTVTPLTA